MAEETRSGAGDGAPGGQAQRGRSQQGQRNRQRSANQARFRNRSGDGALKAPQPKKFVGKEEGLGDEYVYQHAAGRDAADQFARTTEEIIRYTSTKHKNGADVERSLADRVKITVAMPTPPTGTGTPAVISDPEMATWKMRVGIALQRASLLDSNLERACGLIRGQCSKPIMEKVEGQTGHQAVHQARDPIGLIELIKGVMFNYNSKKYRAMTLIDIIKPDIVSQTRHMSDSDYLERFRTQLDVLKSAGGDMCHHQGMRMDELKRAGVASSHATATEKATATQLARGRFEAALFLAKSNQNRCGRLVQELANDYNKGVDSYPSTLTAACELILHDVRDQDSKPQPHGSPGVAFSTVGGGSPPPRTATAGVPGTNTQPNPRPDVTCHKCGKTGHFSNKCAEVLHADGTTLVLCGVVADVLTSPGGTDDDSGEDAAFTLLGSVDDAHGFQFMNNGVVERGDHVPGLVGRDDDSDSDDDEDTVTEHLSDTRVHSQHKAATGKVVPSSWILLDNQSTVDVFSNKDLLQDMRKVADTCRISCNAGVVRTNLVGDLPGYPVPVWCHPKGIANILSLHRVTQNCEVSYHSKRDGASFVVTKDDGSVRHFKPSISGLHYCDTNEFGITLINTVAGQKSKHTARAYKQAVLARRIQDIIGRPSTRDYVKIVEGGMLHNCPVSRADIAAAEDIFGPNLGSLKGKTVRRKSSHAPSLVADVPHHIIKTHKDVTLCFDIMFVNKIAILVTVSRNIRFGATERLTSRNADVVGKALVVVIRFYQQRGFRVRECHGDGEFESLRACLADVHAQLNVTSEDEHVPTIERYIRTLKERTRGTYNTLPFKMVPGMMIVEMVHGNNYWLNMFPANDGVSAAQSPRRIMTGQQGDYHLHCRLQFGEYVQVHESHDNSMTTRTTGAIALRPNGNVQGGFYFMSLTSGQRLNRFAWTPLPMPGEVIERVHLLSRRNPAGGAITFGWRDGTEIADESDDEDDLHDEDYDPALDGYESDSDDDGSYAPEPRPAAGVNEYHDGRQQDFNNPEEFHDAHEELDDAHEEPDGLDDTAVPELVEGEDDSDYADDEETDDEESDEESDDEESDDDSDDNDDAADGITVVPPGVAPTATDVGVQPTGVDPRPTAPPAQGVTTRSQSRHGGPTAAAVRFSEDIDANNGGQVWSSSPGWTSEPEATKDLSKNQGAAVSCSPGSPHPERYARGRVEWACRIF